MAARKPTKAEPKAEPIQNWGIPIALPTQLAYDMAAFANRWPIDWGAPTRPELFRRIADKVMPGHFEWHDWTEKIVAAGCEHSLVALCGCASSAKTYNVAGFAALWWLCDPEESSVMFISTTRDSLRKRGWSQIAKCYTAITPRIGNFVNSKMLWQYTKVDDLHSIFGKAVEEGPQQRVADDIKGYHTRRQMIVIDEATAVPEAIYDAISNLFSYPEEFILFVLANPRNRLDSFGKFIEPHDGWTSVTIDAEQWEGKPQSEYAGRVPVVLRFDAEKSPNIVEGKVVSRHLPTKEKVEAQRNAGGGQTPLWWSNFRGFPPPDGLSKTVFTESAILSNNGFGHFTFTGKDFQIIGAFDHARNGGDRPVLRFAKIGEIEGGKWGMEWMKPIVIGVNADSKTPIDYQLADSVRSRCESFKIGEVEYSCPPENLGVDGTGAGAGFVDIQQRTWNANVIRVLFSAAASEDACSPEDPRPAVEVYENKSVEMHFRAKEALNHGQLRGIDRETAQELVTRKFDDEGKRIKLQKKEDYKKEFGKSPDLSDAGMICFEVARRKNFRLAPIGQTVHKQEQWESLVDKAQEVFNENDAYQPEEDLDTVDNLM
jgi:hypothetical protein